MRAIEDVGSQAHLVIPSFGGVVLDACLGVEEAIEGRGK